MCAENKTAVTELELLGFGHLQNFNSLLFVFFITVYIITLTGNMLIIALIIVNPRLHTPMYFFLCNLSCCEIFFTTNIVPFMLYVIWNESGTMPFTGCITQFYFYTSSGSIECLLLTVMSLDRYLAICIPLRYSSIMNVRLRNHLAIWSWSLGFLVMLIIPITLSFLQFCDSNIIDHIFCDISPILQLSSTNTSVIEKEAFVIAVALCILPFLFIIGSYFCIFLTIARIPSDTGRQKTFSTCSSHLASVCAYFGTLFTIYLVPSQSRSIQINKILSLIYIAVTPLFNPVIYSLRNKDIKMCLLSFIVFKKAGKQFN
ncbi:olfactory receptor 11L1-like [Bombina bombina]|uniref:olfactory receptor 11L1-like n=1 Tax=Bombina bombina TaxID=8345 RepID=UPI00235ADC85|nr:olfactory receptor 11L1-like [Bombina bombina]